MDVEDLSRFDLNLLVAFDVLLRERNVTRAAARLSIGQSAMSAALGRLRRMFEDPILVRQGRQLIATELAEQLVIPVQEILASTQAVLERRDETFDPATDVRKFKIMASEYITLILLQELLVRLNEDYPGIKLQIQPLNEGYSDSIRRGEVDLLIVPARAMPDHKMFPHEHLVTDHYVCAVSQNHPDVGDTIDIETFEELPYLETRVGEQPSLAELQLERLGISRNVELTTSMTMAPFLLRKTKLIALIHERLGKLVAHEVDIRLLDPPFEMEPIHELMVWADRNEPDPGHHWLRQTLHDLVADISGRPSRRRGNI